MSTVLTKIGRLGTYEVPYVNSPSIPFYDDILRFSFFADAVYRLLNLEDPDIVHVNDWLMCYVLGRLEEQGRPRRLKTVLTIHNASYQGKVWKNAVRGWRVDEMHERLQQRGLSSTDPQESTVYNPLRMGVEVADYVTTVSQVYAEELLQPRDDGRFFMGSDGLDAAFRSKRDKGRLVGIRNGYEYSGTTFDEAMKAKDHNRQLLRAEFGDGCELILGFVGRAVEQKIGLLMLEIDELTILEHILRIPGVSIAIVATGDPRYERALERIAGRSGGRCVVTTAFDRVRAGRIYRGGDFFLMPSLFEPCGITQMEAMSYATPVIARATGGLKETITDYDLAHDAGTGILFDGRTRDDIAHALVRGIAERAIRIFREPDRMVKLQQRCFEARFDWEYSASRYVSEIYEPLLRS